MPYNLAVDFLFTGGGTDDMTKRPVYTKTYISPWEKAMKGDETLLATLKTGMPGPHEHKDLPKFKSFNRYFPRGLIFRCFVTVKDFNDPLTLFCQECNAFRRL